MISVRLEPQVSQVLQLMLAYEPEERPTAQQVVELMEALAEEVQDGSLRRFCREVVTPAHALQEPPNNSNDPFTGSTLFEDSSQVRQEDGMEEVEARVVSDVLAEAGTAVLPRDSIETGVEYIADITGRLWRVAALYPRSCPDERSEEPVSPSLRPTPRAPWAPPGRCPGGGILWGFTKDRGR